jgi:hypothetical protein
MRGSAAKNAAINKAINGSVISEMCGGMYRWAISMAISTDAATAPAAVHPMAQPPQHPRCGAVPEELGHENPYRVVATVEDERFEWPPVERRRCGREVKWREPAIEQCEIAQNRDGPPRQRELRPGIAALNTINHPAISTGHDDAPKNSKWAPQHANRYNSGDGRIGIAAASSTPLAAPPVFASTSDNSDDRAGSNACTDSTLSDSANPSRIGSTNRIRPNAGNAQYAHAPSGTYTRMFRITSPVSNGSGHASTAPIGTRTNCHGYSDP